MVPNVAVPTCQVSFPERGEGLLRRAASWIDRKSTPEEDTHGDLSSPAYVQAVVGASVEGFALMGWTGALSASAASLAGVAVEEWTGSGKLAVATGALIGAAVSSATALGGGIGAVVPRAVSGALLGAFQTLGSGRLATVRDSSDGGAMLAGLLMRGPSKVAAGIAAAIAARWIDGVHPAKEAALAAGLGVAMGVGLSAIGFSPLSTLASAVACGAAAGGGVVIGPRFSQLVRNLGKDAGTGIERGLRGTGVIAGPLPATTRNCLGALPAGLASEAVKGLLYADGSPVGIVLGGIGAAVQLVEIYANASPKPLSKRAAAALQRAARSRPAAAPQAAAGAGVPSAAAQSSGDDASLKGAAAGTSAPIPRTAAA